MYAEERQQEILRRVRAAGRVEVATLADDLTVTTETIRRDLTVLERAGVVRLVHGGAMPIERLGLEPVHAERDATMMAERERIAKAALSELPEGGSITIDAGTIATLFAETIPMDRALTVIVNASPLATRLAARPNLAVIILGGRVHSRTLTTVDDRAISALSNIFVDVAFMGTDGLSPERGLSTPHRQRRL